MTGYPCYESWSVNELRMGLKTKNVVRWCTIYSYVHIEAIYPRYTPLYIIEGGSLKGIVCCRLPYLQLWFRWRDYLGELPPDRELRAPAVGAILMVSLPTVLSPNMGIVAAVGLCASVHSTLRKWAHWEHNIERRDYDRFWSTEPEETNYIRDFLTIPRMYK